MKFGCYDHLEVLNWKFQLDIDKIFTSRHSRVNFRINSSVVIASSRCSKVGKATSSFSIIDENSSDWILLDQKKTINSRISLRSEPLTPGPWLECSWTFRDHWVSRSIEEYRIVRCRWLLAIEVPSWATEIFQERIEWQSRKRNKLYAEIILRCNRYQGTLSDGVIALIARERGRLAMIWTPELTRCAWAGW